MELLKKIPLPIIRSTETLDEDDLAAEQRRQQQQYVLTQAEERLVQVRLPITISRSKTDQLCAVASQRFPCQHTVLETQ